MSLAHPYRERRALASGVGRWLRVTNSCCRADRIPLVLCGLSGDTILFSRLRGAAWLAGEEVAAETAGESLPGRFVAERRTTCNHSRQSRHDDTMDAAELTINRTLCGVPGFILHAPALASSTGLVPVESALSHYSRSGHKILPLFPRRLWRRGKRGRERMSGRSS